MNHVLTGSTSTAANGADTAALIARVNQLYHELTQSEFDSDHAYRHAVEGPFWRWVAETILADRLPDKATGSAGVPPAFTPWTVLDVACGTGFVTNLLRPYLHPYDQLLAMDLSVPALRTTRTKWIACCDLAASLSCLSAASDRLPLPDTSVEVIAMNAALHHFADPLAVLGELDRVLKPGGYFALGFEPNAPYFASTLLPLLGRCVDRIGWYFSPNQNRRRIRKLLGREPRLRNRRVAAAPVKDFVSSAINRRLLVDGLISEPLSREEILDLVDPHARGAEGCAGFDADLLVRGNLPSYRVLHLSCSDYLGESMRRLPRVRGALDSILRVCLPGRGSLFCWLLQKGGAE